MTPTYRLCSLRRLTHVLAICSILSLAACGGSDNSGPPVNGPSDGGGPGAGAGADQIPSTARRDGKSLVAWMSTWVTSTDDNAEPLAISTEPLPMDDTAEPEPL